MKNRHKITAWQRALAAEHAGAKTARGLKVPAAALTVAAAVILTALLAGCTVRRLDPGTVITPGSSTPAEAAGTPTNTVTYIISYIPGEGGSISGDLRQTVEKGQFSAEVTAIPAKGYIFKAWSDGSTEPVRSDLAESDIELTALFQQAYRVNFVCVPEGAGVFEGSATQLIAAGETVQAVSVKAAAGYRFTGWDGGSIDAEYPAFTPEADVTVQAHFEEIQTVSDMYIVTADGEGINSREVYKDAAVSVNTLIESRCFENAACTVRGHGNSSWIFMHDEKPSYRLKLAEKTDLLGIAPEPVRDYVLISNHQDKIMLRNWTAQHLAGMLGTIPYVRESRFVNLYVNGEYRGVYQLFVKIETGKGRIDIDDSGEEADTGYLIELDMRVAEEGKKPYFELTGTGTLFAIKSDGANEAQVAFIKNYVTEFYKAIQSGSREAVEQYADLDSLLDMFILEEFTRERDAGFSSFYIIKEKGGKLVFGPPWDYDLSLGGDNMFRATRKLVTDNEERANVFFKALLANDWFRELVRARLTELLPTFEQLIADFREMAEFMRAPNAANDSVWHVYGRRILWEPDVLAYELKTYDEQVDHMENWMRLRLAFLKEYFSVTEN